MAKCYKPHTGADYYTILLHLFCAACYSYFSKGTNLKILVTGASSFIGSRLVRSILIIPFLTPRLSSYWVDLVTPVKASLARPLIDSLKHEARVNDDSINIIITIPLKNFEESIKAAKEEVQIKKTWNIF